MSRFTAPLIVTPTADYRGWEVIGSTEEDEDGSPVLFGYDMGHEGSGLVITVPYLFVTDFASIPWFARWLIKSWGRHTNAAVIHDYCYRGGQPDTTVMEGPVIQQLSIPLSRKNADMIMLEAMTVMNVKPWRRQCIYWGLRIGGWWAWRKKR